MGAFEKDTGAYGKVSRSSSKLFDEEAMAEHLSILRPQTQAEALGLLRKTFPDIPLSRRVAACSHFRLDMTD